MLPQRTAIARAVHQLRPSNFSRRSPASLLTRQAGRRAYASASETAEKATHAAKKVVKQSELPWILGAAGVTIPGTYFILANGTWGAEADYPGAKWHGEHDDEEHDEEEKEEGEEGGDAEKEAGEGEEKEEGDAEKEAGEGEEKEEGDDKEQEEEGKDAKDEGGEGEEGAENKEADTAAKDDSQGEGENAPGQPGPGDKFSKNTNDGSDANVGDIAEQDDGDSESVTTRKPDAKGGVKRRTESGNATKLGEKGDEDHPDDDKASSGKPAKRDSQEGKQSGLSNTDTKHSVDIGNSSESSKKAPGTPETAKSEGTVKA